LSYLYNRGINDFFFVDEVLTDNMEDMTKLCKLIMGCGMKITWTCNSRLHSKAINPETFALMKKAGCTRIDFGVELENNNVLGRIKKGITVELVLRAYKIVEDAGLTTTSLMMCGHPHETIDEINDSVSLVSKLDMDYVEFTVATSFPGTELFQLARQNGGIKTYDWDDYVISIPKGIMDNDVFTAKQLLPIGEYASSLSKNIAAIRRFSKEGGNSFLLFAKLLARRYFHSEQGLSINLVREQSIFKKYFKRTTNQDYSKELEDEIHSILPKNFEFLYFTKDPENLFDVKVFFDTVRGPVAIGRIIALLLGLCAALTALLPALVVCRSKGSYPA
jgi:radical SAM superfamily enzyme YgiQ (UPF0313 family)